MIKKYMELNFNDYSKYLFLITAFLLCCFSTLTLYSQEEIKEEGIVNDESYFSLDSLLNHEISGALKYNEQINNSGNSVTIITYDEIKKLGFTNLQEVIAYSADFYESNDGIWNYIGVRGLIFPSSYGSRIPFTINGHHIEDYTYGSIVNSNLIGLGLELIERVEIISGTPSAFYGSNSIIGAINIITKEGKDIVGGVVSAGISTEGKSTIDFVIGNNWDNGLDMIFSYRGSYFGGSDYYFMEYDNTQEYGDPTSPLYNERAANNGIAHNKNNYLKNIFLFSAKYENFGLNIVQTTSNRRYNSAGFGSIFNDPDANYDGYLTDISLNYRYNTDLIKGEHTIIPQIFYNYSKSDFHYNYKNYEDGNTEIINQIERPIYSGIGFGIKDLWEITPSDMLTIGIKYVHSFNYDIEFLEWYNGDKDDDMVMKNVLKPLSIFSASAEYTREISDLFTAFIGGRIIQSFDYNQIQLLPRAGIVFNIDRYSTLKAIFGTSGRRCSGYEVYTSTELIEDSLGNYTTINSNNLNYEIARSLELIYLFRARYVIGNFSLFYNAMKNIIYEDTIIDIEKPDIYYPYTYVNMDKSLTLKSYGISATLLLKSEWGGAIRLSDVVSFVDVNSDNSFLLEATTTNSPQNIFYCTISYELLKFLNFNIMGIYESRRETIALKKLKNIADISISLTYNPAYTNEKIKFLNKFYFALNMKNILNEKNYYPVNSSIGIIDRYSVDNGFNVGLNVGYKF
jgi:iron complex outermembrane receptor protein